MEERNIKLSKDRAIEWYNGNDTTLKKLALQAYTKEELHPSFRNIKTFDDACKVLGISDLEFKGCKNINYNKQDIQGTFNGVYALAKLPIIRKALNKGYKMELIKGEIYYPSIFFVTKECRTYDNEFNNKKLIKISNFIVDEVEYILVGSGAYSGSNAGLGCFYSEYGVSASGSSLGFLGCATKEIAEHMSRYFAKEIFEAMYTGWVDFKWVG